MPSDTPPSPILLLSEWELWACANAYVQQHGIDAPIHAAMRVDHLNEIEDESGAANWRIILRRINEILARPSTLPN